MRISIPLTHADDQTHFDIGNAKDCMNKIVLFTISVTAICIGNACFAIGENLPAVYFDENTGKYGFKAENGMDVFSEHFDVAYDFNEHGVAAVVKDGKWVYINSKGEPLVEPFIFDNGPDYFVEGFSRFVANGKMGFINEAAELTVPAEYDFIYPFSESRALFCMDCKKSYMGEHYIMKGGKWGFIDTFGRVVAPAKYDAADDFKNGEAKVQLNGSTIYIDKNGEQVKTPLRPYPKKP